MRNMRTTHTKIGITVLGIALMAASTAQAQQLEPPTPRQGYYIAAGLLSGINYVREDGSGQGVWPGSGFSLRLGQLITRRFGLGLEIDSGGGKKGQRTAGMFGLGVEGNVALWRTLALHAGVGLGVLSLEDKSDPNADLEGTYGTQYQVGLSYDFYPFGGHGSGGFSLTPVIQTRLVPGDKSGLLVLTGLEIGWWTGLPRNQLQLPESDAYKR